MDNPETLATPGTQDEDKQNSRTQKTKKISNTDGPQLFAKGKQFLPPIRQGKVTYV